MKKFKDFINENLSKDEKIMDMVDYLMNHWSKNEKVKKEIEDVYPEFKKYLDYTRDDWYNLNYDELNTLIEKWKTRKD